LSGLLRLEKIKVIMDTVKKIKIALLVAGLMLCFAVIPLWPNAFYVLLRWTVCMVCGYSAYVLSKGPLFTKHAICLGFLAVLFNPIFVMPFDLSLWILVYLGSAICLLTLARKIT